MEPRKWPEDLELATAELDSYVTNVSTETDNWNGDLKSVATTLALAFWKFTDSRTRDSLTKKIVEGLMKIREIENARNVLEDSL